MANALPVSPTPPVAAPLQPAPPVTPPSPAPSAPPVMPATPAPVVPATPVAPASPTPAAPTAPTPSVSPAPPTAPTMMAGNAMSGPAPKSGSPLPIILVGIILLVAGAGAYFWYSNQQQSGGVPAPADMAQTEQSDTQLPENTEVVMATESDDSAASQIEAANRAAVAAAAEGAVTKDTNCYSIALPAGSSFGDENSCNQFIEIPGEPSLNMIVEPIWGYKNFTTSAEAAAQAIISGEKLSETPLTVGGLEAIKVVDVTNASGDEHVMVFVVKKGSTYTVQGVPVSGFEISTVFLNQDDKDQRMAQFEAALNSIVWK